MSSTSLAYLSNNLIYSSLFVFTITFFMHAIETAWSVRGDESATRTNVFDRSKTEKVARIATALMILGFLLLLAGVIVRGLSAHRVPWGNMYEFSITGALAFTGAYLAALKKFELRWLGLPT